MKSKFGVAIIALALALPSSLSFAGSSVLLKVQMEQHKSATAPPVSIHSGSMLAMIVTPFANVKSSIKASTGGQAHADARSVLASHSYGRLVAVARRQDFP